MKISNLPEDLVVEILSRVPAVSLARLRSTSKEWNGLIKNGRLAKKHYANAPRHSFLALVLIEYRLYLMSFNLHGIHNNVAPSCLFTLKDPVSNSSLNEVDIRDVFHCEGLLLCTTKENRLVVWNPCSGETRWIQPRNSYKESDLFSLGYDNKSSRYKILRMDRFCVQTEYEVYDFTSNSWRVVVGKTRDWFIRDGYTHGVFVNGNTYWLATTQNFENEDEYEYESLLLSFDFSTEIFGSVSLPGNLFTIPLALSVTRQTQQLCMLLNDIFMSNVYYIRIATKSDSTGAMSWNKFLTVSEDDLRYRFQFKTGVSYLAGQEKENKVVVSCNRPSRVSKNIMHIMGENEYIELDHHGAKPPNESPTPLFLSYVPSLVQIQQGI